MSKYICGGILCSFTHSILQYLGGTVCTAGLGSHCVSMLKLITRCHNNYTLVSSIVPLFGMLLLCLERFLTYSFLQRVVARVDRLTPQEGLYLPCGETYTLLRLQQPLGGNLKNPFSFHCF